MRNPLISTIICTYNAEAYINNTLLSALEQTYENQEILILDNWSTDKTIEILEKHAKNNAKVKIFNEWKNLWAYNWLNYLLDRAQWEYIAIQDHDDIWYSDKLRIQVEFLETHPEYIWSGTGTLMYYGKSKLWFLYDTKDRNTTKVIHTSLVFRNQWFRYDTENDFLCDWYFMQNILTKGKDVLKVHPEALTLHYYKETGTNYSEQWFKLSVKNIKRYFDVYGVKFYFCILLIYIIFFSYIKNYRIKRKIDFTLLCWIKWAKPKKYLEESSKYLKEMLGYYN